jgi:enoyl-CoA hydratase
MLLTRTLPALRSTAPAGRLYLRAMSTSAEPLVLSSRSPNNSVAILTLNRPKALNALSSPLFDQLNAELEKADEDDTVRAIVITGSEKAFAAGADIKEMKDKECEWVGDGTATAPLLPLLSLLSLLTTQSPRCTSATSSARGPRSRTSASLSSVPSRASR